jgi:hypothetical protein
MSEFLQTALLLSTFGLLIGTSVLFSRALERVGIPLALFFLGLGMLAASSESDATAGPSDDPARASKSARKSTRAAPRQAVARRFGERVSRSRLMVFSSFG